MPWFPERSSSKFFCLTQWWIVTDVWELSQPFTKISLLCFTRSKGLGNKTLKELWQRERWMSRKWKGLVACSSSHCTDSGGAVWEGTLIVLASPLPGTGMNSLLQHLTQETQPVPMGWVVNGSRVSHCCFSMYPLLLLPAVLGIHSFSPLRRKYCDLHVLSIWLSICKLYHHCAYFTRNINYALFSCVLLKDT